MKLMMLADLYVTVSDFTTDDQSIVADIKKRCSRPEMLYKVQHNTVLHGQWHANNWRQDLYQCRTTAVSWCNCRQRGH